LIQTWGGNSSDAKRASAIGGDGVPTVGERNPEQPTGAEAEFVRVKRRGRGKDSPRMKFICGGEQRAEGAAMRGGEPPSLIGAEPWPANQR
jgi:hypothetical protein